MKMTKKAMLMLLTVCVVALCTVLCAANVSAAEITASGECGDNLTWVLYDDGELVIDGSGDMWDWTAKNSAPWYDYRSQITTAAVEDGVTSIGAYAFSYCIKLGNVSLPEGITSIGSHAFHQANIAAIDIPASTTEIGNLAFHKCNALTAIYVAEENPYFTDLAGILYSKDMTILIKYPANKEDKSYTIPDGVTYVYDYSFFGCKYLKELLLSDDVRTIGECAFTGCRQIASLHITKFVKTIAHRALAQTDSLAFISVAEGNAYFSSDKYGVLFNQDKTKLLRFPIGSTMTDYTVPASVTTVGGWAFENAVNLEKVVLPESVASFEKAAFSVCTKLKTAAVYNRNAVFADIVFNSPGESLTLYGYKGSTAEAYASENGLRFGYFSEPQRVITASGECGDNLTWTLYADGELVISGEGDMWDYTSKKDSPWLAYTNKVDIKTLTIKEGVTSVGNYAFYSLYALTSVSIPEGVTSIGDTAFGFCLKLPTLTLPSTVKTIGLGAIRACRELTTFTFPAGVTEISTYVLADCYKLESIFVDKANPFYCTENGVLFNKDKTTLIQYPAGKRDVQYSVPGTVVSVESGSFYGCRYLETLCIHKDVTLISIGAFLCSDSIKCFTVDENNTLYSSDNHGVLYNKDMTQLIRYPAGSTVAEYTVDDNVEEICSKAFDGCIHLESVTFLSSDTVFESPVFRDVAEYLVLYGYSGSTAEAYAAAYGHKFIALSEKRITGDITGDNQVDISDAVLLFYHSMIPEMYPISYPFSLDFNKDGFLDVGDSITLFWHSMLPDMYPIE